VALPPKHTAGIFKEQTMTKKREKSLGYVVNHLSRAMTQAMSDEICTVGRFARPASGAEVFV